MSFHRFVEEVDVLVPGAEELSIGFVGPRAIVVVIPLHGDNGKVVFAVVPGRVFSRAAGVTYVDEERAVEYPGMGPEDNFGHLSSQRIPPDPDNIVIIKRFLEVTGIPARRFGIGHGDDQTEGPGTVIMLGDVDAHRVVGKVHLIVFEPRRPRLEDVGKVAPLIPDTALSAWYIDRAFGTGPVIPVPSPVLPGFVAHATVNGVEFSSKEKFWSAPWSSNSETTSGRSSIIAIWRGLRPFTSAPRSSSHFATSILLLLTAEARIGHPSSPVVSGAVPQELNSRKTPSTPNKKADLMTSSFSLIIPVIPRMRKKKIARIAYINYV